MLALHLENVGSHVVVSCLVEGSDDLHNTLASEFDALGQAVSGAVSQFDVAQAQYLDGN